MLSYQVPLDFRTSSYSYGGVLDLRTVKVDSSNVMDTRSGWGSGTESMSPRECAVLTPPRDVSVSPPVPPVDIVSPTLAITQRVLAAASAPQGTRPFKAYPKDPLSITSHSDAYLQFRQQMLSQVKSSSKSVHSRKRPASPSSPSSSSNHLQIHSQHHHQQGSSSGADSDDKDAAYWERRRKNNEAAKKSRDARRAKEDEIAIRAAFLEQENLRLKYQVAALTDETAKLRCMLYNTEYKSHKSPDAV